MTSIPVYNFITNSTVDSTKVWGLAINMNDPSDQATIDEIALAFLDVDPYLHVETISASDGDK